MTEALAAAADSIDGFLHPTLEAFLKVNIVDKVSMTSLAVFHDVS